MIVLDVYNDGYVCDQHGHTGFGAPWHGACGHIAAQHRGDDCQIVSHSGPMPPETFDVTVQLTREEMEVRGACNTRSNLWNEVADRFTEACRLWLAEQPETRP